MSLVDFDRPVANLEEIRRVNPQRFDPYKNFKFRVKWDGRYVAGISKVSATVEIREGK